MHRKVDPAALLFSIFAVALGPLTTVGPWDLLNSVIAGVVGVVLAAFTWPREEILQDEHGNKVTEVDAWVMFAQALAYGLIIAIGIAWVVQSIWLHVATSVSCASDPSTDGYSAACLQIAQNATYVAVLIGLAAAITLFYKMRNQTEKITGIPLGPVLRPWLHRRLQRMAARAPRLKVRL
jgi:hypothetical protein